MDESGSGMTVKLPPGWSVVATRYGSQTNGAGEIVRGYTIIVQLPTTTQIQVFIPQSIITQTEAVREAIVAEGNAVLAVHSL